MRQLTTENLKQQILRAIAKRDSVATSVEIREKLIAEKFDPGVKKLLATLSSLENAFDVSSVAIAGKRFYGLTEKGRAKVTAAQMSLI